MISQFGIHLKVTDFKKSLFFYKKLGFKEFFAYGGKKFLESFGNSIPTAPEKYNGVVFKINNTLFEIADGHIAVKPEVFKQKIESSKISAMIQVGSLYEIIKICKKNRFKIAVQPRIFPWGTREMVIKDPDGFVLVFMGK